MFFRKKYYLVMCVENSKNTFLIVNVIHVRL